MRFHAEIPLIALFARMHLGVSGIALVLCRRRRRYQGGINGSANFKQQAFAGKLLIDGGQYLLCQLVLFQPVAKPQNSGLIWQTAMRIKLGKLAAQGHIEEGLFHGGVGQGEPLLHEVNPQHGLKSKRRSTVFPLGVVRGDELDQRGPRHDAIHFKQELALAGLFVAKVQIKAGLLHGLYVQ